MKCKCKECGKYADVRCIMPAVGKENKDGTWSFERIEFCSREHAEKFQKDYREKKIKYKELLRLKVKEGILTEADIERYPDPDEEMPFTNVTHANLGVC